MHFLIETLLLVLFYGSIIWFESYIVELARTLRVILMLERPVAVY